MTVPDADDLPILAELEASFARMVREELQGTGSEASRFAPAGPGAARGAVARPGAEPTRGAEPPAQLQEPSTTPAPVRRPSLPGHRRRRERGPLASRLPFPTGRRILARALAAGALAGVVGATALATKSVVGHGGGDAPRTLQRVDGHKVTLRQYRGRWCLDVTYAGGVASRCVAPPGDDGVAPLSAAVPRGRVVVGLAGAGVERITVRRSGHAATVATHAVGASPKLRWFAVALDRVPHEARHAAVVVPSPEGRAVADCTLGTAASCQTAREHSEVRM